RVVSVQFSAFHGALVASLSPVHPSLTRIPQQLVHNQTRKMRSRVTTPTARTSTSSSTLLAVYRPAAHTATALQLSGTYLYNIFLKLLSLFFFAFINRFITKL